MRCGINAFMAGCGGDGGGVNRLSSGSAGSFFSYFSNLPLSGGGVKGVVEP
jgi:hypothetical protein